MKVTKVPFVPNYFQIGLLVFDNIFFVFPIYTKEKLGLEADYENKAL